MKWFSISSICLFLFFHSCGESEAIDFDTAKAIKLLNDLVAHPRAVIDQLEKYKITDLIAALGIHGQSNYTISKECHEELTFLGYGLLEVARHPKKIYPNDNQSSIMTDDERRHYLIPMMDAAGKIGSGIARGHLLSSGQFIECKSVKMYSTSLKREVRGDYYRINFDIKMRSHTFNDTCGVPQIGVDICLPMVCQHEDLTEYFRSAFSVNPAKSPICSVDNVNQRIPKVVITTYIVGGVLLAIVITSIIAGTVDYYFENRGISKIDYDNNRKNECFCYKFFMAFSFYQNVKDIFSLKGSKKGGQVKSVHCIRTISTVWVILGHCSALMILVCTNPLDMVDYTLKNVGLFMANAYFAVDTFFFLSGFLLTFLWFKDLNRRRRAVLSCGGWLMYYVHRIARLTPVYYITIFFFTFIFSRVVHDMPLFMSPAVQDDSCAKNFWLNLLYIDNIVDPKHICYVISWYLATDTQIYFGTPLILLPFAYGGKVVGTVVALLAIGASTAFNAWQMFAWNFPPTQFQFGPVNPKFNPELRRYDLWNYYNPLIRCQIYIMGMIVGYYMHLSPKIKINAWIDRFMWAVSLGGMVFVILILQDYTGGNLWTPMENAIYSSSSRIIWGLCLTYIVFSTYYREGLINDFMSLPVWTPLSRLSFCAYLIHIMVIAYFFGKNHSDLYFSTLPYFFIEMVIPVTCISFILAIFWSAMFEIPFAKIEMLLLPGGRRSQQTQAPPPITNGNEKHIQSSLDGVLKIPVNFPEDTTKDIHF